MQFTLSDEQTLLGATIRDLLSEKMNRDQLRSYVDSGSPHSPELWELMTKHLGLAGIAVPEELGGAGGSIGDLTVVLEETGRALLCGPFFANSVLAVTAIRESRDESAQHLHIPRLISGVSVGTLAYKDISGVPTRAVETADGWVLSGNKQHVIDGLAADLMVVSAATENGLALFALHVDQPRITVDPAEALDPTRRLATLRLDAAPATLLGTVQEGQNALRRTLQIAQLCLAAEQVGGAQHCLDRTVRHVLDRSLNGRPLAVLQAVKHRCSDMYVGIELARATNWYAVWALQNDATDKESAVAAAGAAAAAAYYTCSTSYMQLSGGIGYTWEHDAHLHLKRAICSRATFAVPDELYERIADQALGM